MSVAPADIGQSSNYVRESVTEQLTRIDQEFFADPVWCANNNQASITDKAAGVLIFNITFNGLLNDTELTTAANGWVTAGWDTATATNNLPKRSDASDNKTWTLSLTYHP